MAQETTQFIDELLLDPDKEAISAEMSALQSIYGENSLELWKENGNGTTGTTTTIRYQLIVR